VPGPPGRPILSVLHGAEKVRTPAQEMALGAAGGSGGLMVIKVPVSIDGREVGEAVAEVDARNAKFYRGTKGRR